MKKGFTLIELLISLSIVSIISIAGLNAWEIGIKNDMKNKLMNDANAIVKLQEKAKSDIGYYLKIKKTTENSLEPISKEGYNFIISLPETLVVIEPDGNCFSLYLEKKSIEKTVLFNSCYDSQPYFLK